MHAGYEQELGSHPEGPQHNVQEQLQAQAQKVRAQGPIDAPTPCTQHPQVTFGLPLQLGHADNLVICSFKSWMLLAVSA